MKFLKRFLPNLTLALNLALMIVIYLDLRNPKMGFLVGAPFLTLVACSCIGSIAVCVVLYAGTRKKKKHNSGKTE